ncbi:MerR family transcriptional regulator [Agrococcus sp. Ld7]|uniref:MerR family transcriptional regulator n=1 Tax=Agrococcus sp. Ld7 TaxID=649148 RepID=UPI0038665351
MPWSTRELAELAGTTVNTVRHYHRLGLLPVPERRFNGYKQYGVAELVCLLRIRRLADLGMPLSRIAEVTADDSRSPQVLRAVDDDLAVRIAQLQQARADIAAILRDSAPADAPRGFESVASRLSEADSSIIHIYSRLYEPDVLADLVRMVESDGAVEQEFDVLGPDADEPTVQRVAEGMAPGLAQHLIDYPWLRQPAKHLKTSGNVAQDTFVQAVLELYNPAQLEVLQRASMLAQQLLTDETTPANSETSAPARGGDDDVP